MIDLGSRKNWRVEFGFFIGFIILGIVLPNNVMEYAWAQWFVAHVGVIVPAAKNFATNPYAHPISPVLYGGFGLALYILFILQFVFYGLKPNILPQPFSSERYNKVFTRSWGRMMLHGLAFIFIVVGLTIGLLTMLGDDVVGDYVSRYEAIPYSWFGALSMYNIIYCFSPKILYAIIMLTVEIYQLRTRWSTIQDALVHKSEIKK